MSFTPRQQIVADAWADPAMGYVSADRLHKKLQITHSYLDLKAKEVQDVIDRLPRAQQFRTSKKHYDTITAPWPRFSYQIDLADMANYKAQNNNVSFCFLCIDVYSRYAMWIPCKNKSIATVKACLNIVFLTMGKPLNITSDFEASVLSNDVQAWLTSQDVKHWPVKEERKLNNMIVERNIRTMREMVAKAFANLGTRRWVGPLILALNESYNNAVNRMTKATPFALWNGDAVSAQQPVTRSYPFEIGDRVRVRNQKGFKDTFAKTSAMKTFTKAVYIITGRINRRFICTNPATGATTDRMGYDLLLVPKDTVEWKLNNDGLYTKHKQTGKQAKAARSKRYVDQELQRESIDATNVLSAKRARALPPQRYR